MPISFHVSFLPLLTVLVDDGTTPPPTTLLVSDTTNAIRESEYRDSNAKWWPRCNAIRGVATPILSIGDVRKGG